MKSIKTLLLISAPALLAALVLLPVSVQADAKGGGSRQLALSRGPIAAVSETSTVSAPMAMSCAKCADTRTVVSAPTFKAVQPVVKYVVSTHVCPSCSTMMTSVGHGKLATQTATHSCPMETKGCCAGK